MKQRPVSTRQRGSIGGKSYEPRLTFDTTRRTTLEPGGLFDVFAIDEHVWDYFRPKKCLPFKNINNCNENLAS